MKIARLVGLVFAAVLAVAAVSASAAMATAPEFSKTAKFTGAGLGANVLTASTTSISCTGESNTGEITGVKKVGKVVVKFTTCTANSGACEAKSTGAKSGEIVTLTLKGELGITTQSATGVGLLLEPETTKKFVHIEASCTSPTETEVSGTIAGEASPIKSSQTTGKLVFGVTSGAQNITAINILGTTVKPELEAFGVKATQATVNDVTYSAAVEVS